MSNLADRDVEQCGDQEKQDLEIPKKGGEQYSRNDTKREKILSPWTSSGPTWTIYFFLLSFVIGVATDPLFLYVPIINEDEKCLTMDEKMKSVALILRMVSDFTYLSHLFFQCHGAFKTSKEFNLSISTGFPWLSILIDILAVIPLPQVIFLAYFSEIAGSRSLSSRKMLSFLLMLQYVPRILRVYLSAKDLGRAFDSATRRAWVKGGLNFFLYALAGHVFGAFWYFYSMYRETACWHHACESYPGCVPGPFKCHDNIPLTNLTFINDFCPVYPPNPEVFDFGIFADAIGANVLRSTNFIKKFSHCFWWGLRNLSSFGSNLETSSNIEENFFAVLISMLGLLLFLYLIGNLQTYMQRASESSEKIRQKINNKKPEIESYLSNHHIRGPKKNLIMRYLRHTIKEGKDVDVKHLFSLLLEHMDNSHRAHDENSEVFAKWVTKITDEEKQKKDTIEQQAQLWIDNCKIPNEIIRRKIMQYVRLRMREGKDVDVSNLLHILPIALGMSVKKHLCFPILQKVQMLQNMDDSVYETICHYLKPVIHTEKSYIIRKGEPVDFLLFVTQGIVWNFGSDTNAMERLQKGDYYGKELLEWRLNSTSHSNFPISPANLKCHMKVEGFALMASDLEHVLSKCWSKFLHSDKPTPEGLKPFAAASLQHEFRRFMRKKKTNQPKWNVCNESKLSVGYCF